MNFAKNISDPARSKIAFELEATILRKDEELAREGVAFTDAHVKSAMAKAINQLRGKRPKSQPKKAIELHVANLGEQLSSFCQQLEMEIESAATGETEVLILPASEYVLVLESLKDSLDTRHEMAGHARGYLDFLKRFIENGDAR